MKTNRRVASEKKWTEIINNIETSGMKVTEYCRAHGVNKSGYYLWRAKLKVKEVAVVNSKIFSEVKIIPRLEPSNRKLPNAKWLAEILLALSQEAS